MFLLWLKKWWKWVVVALAMIGVFLAGFFSRKPKILTPSKDVDEGVSKIEGEAKREETRAGEHYTEEVKKIEGAHDDKVEQFKKSQEEKTEDIKGNPDSINEWLHEVGSKNR